ncbi:MAG: zinc dependent phospholipase C family protein [Faecalimonas sp.]|nr:zinc dependent phospholipase C family protein [Faecalimonas sp.]
MPSDYTHLCFGRKAIAHLPKQFADAVAAHPTLFEIGLQGPDILFFYQPLHSCPVNKTGYVMHDASAKEFFLPTRDILKTSPDKAAALSYLAGFLCHYVLDLSCHGYVEKKLSVSALTHAGIEKEFDRYLMEQDGGSTKLICSPKDASVISAFFPDISARQVQQAVRSMNLFTNLLSGKGLRRPLVTAVLKLSGQYDKLYDMLLPKKSPTGSEDSNLRLQKLMDKALILYEKLAKEYLAFLEGAAYPAGMSETFGPTPDWEEIPVLSFEEEQAYEPKLYIP